jgi:soluble lytic murein transglycosylase
MTLKRILRLFILVTAVTSTLSACLQPGPSPNVAEPKTIEVLEMTSTPTPAITPTATPTQPPEELVSKGEMALFVGDYDSAYDIFLKSLNQNPNSEIAAEAYLGLGQALFYQDEFGLALDYLRQAASSEDAAVAGRANCIMGKIYVILQRYEDALASYQTYLDLRPGIIDSHVHELRGDIFNTLGNYAQAAASYENAIRANTEINFETVTIKFAVTYQNQGDLETALSLYKNIYDSTDNDYTKAEMDLRMGRIYLEQANLEEAYALFQDAVNNFPYTFDAYSALLTLVEDGVEVNEYQRGLVNYYRENYELAIDAFDRHLSSDREDNLDAALYYQALAVRAAGTQSGIGRNEEAIALWQQLINEYPVSTYYVDAWEDIEYTQWAYMEEHEAAAETSLTYVAQRPESPEAPNFLFLAGRAYERAGLLDLAVQTWTRLASEYPASDRTFQSTYFAGIARVRQGDWEKAQPLFARALVLTSEPAELAAAYLWIGKCQEAQGDISAALDSWKIAQTSDPFGHYSIRAEDLLIGQSPFTPPEDFQLDPDLTAFRLEAEAWLRETFTLAGDTNLESPGLLAVDPRFQRGLEFWALGNYIAAKAEFESMRLDYESDPAQTFRLIPALVEIGLYRSALVATTNLLKSAGLEGADALQAPEFFSRVRFGAYYLDWLIPVAEAEEISPLLLLSVIRQESTYEGFIDSGAGARGLMQIIPATGEQLASELNWPENYSVDDLYRPHVSLIFGANYLKKQRNLFNGDLFAMLAAYNGGPGNTLIWKELAGTDDPDLFLETVRIEETRNYIRLINEIHAVYRWLYGENPSLLD